jgi:hypothetical protein
MTIPARSTGKPPRIAGRPTEAHPRGTKSSNPVPSRAESAANFVFGREAWKGPRRRQGTIPTVSTSSGTEGSNPLPSSDESCANLTSYQRSSTFAAAITASMIRVRRSRVPVPQRAMSHRVCRRAHGSVPRGYGAVPPCRYGSGDRWGTPRKVPAGSFP